MKYSDLSENLHIELDTKNCELSPAEIERMEGDLDQLAKVVEDFPVSHLYVTAAHYPRSLVYHVKAALVLPGRTLVTGDSDDRVAEEAFQRCVRKLVQRVQHYKSQLSDDEGLSKRVQGTVQDIDPTQVPELGVLEAAVRTGEYRTFRREMSGFEEALRRRVGRWVQHYPELDGLIGDALSIDDIMEEVFLNAFEQWDQRPEQIVRLGDWLEALIDPSLRDLLRHPEEEDEAISFARTLREIPTAELEG
ncbi:MAG: hypothetical protein KY476_05670 [Planctomycetes bacterium]|nr:hypothetical protein [Planctomycetota bacterium]